ncbi:MAG: hypothetical protein JWM80_3288 [Cyanobacteria bacterium RYN_339]|nr:hypothetical protein [Cyanobacteria bacterium RYN_339]
MRFNVSAVLAAGLALSFASPAWALPTKAEGADRSKSDAHGKAGLVDWAAPPVQVAAVPVPVVIAAKPAAKPAPKAAPKPAAKPVFVPHPTVAHLRSTEVLGVENVSPAVDFVPVLPGERVPLRAISANGKPVAATWRSNGGTLAFGDHMAVWQAPLEPGVMHVTGYGLVNGRTVRRNLTMVVIIPGAKVTGGKLNGYPIGIYPKGYGTTVAGQVANRGTRDAYEVPPGFVELTAANVNMPVSEHYKLGDFAGKDNWVGGHKYLMVQPRVVEKLERIIMTLHAEGYPCGKLELMSAYRSPFLNEDIGNTTTLSRHTYGDAVDMLVPDLNKDGKSDKADAGIMMAAITKLDKAGILTGGGSIYAPNGAHGFFIHTDTRGALVRW